MRGCLGGRGYGRTSACAPLCRVCVAAQRELLLAHPPPSALIRCGGLDHLPDLLLTGTDGCVRRYCGRRRGSGGGQGDTRLVETLQARLCCFATAGNFRVTGKRRLVAKEDRTARGDEPAARNSTAVTRENGEGHGPVIQLRDNTGIKGWSTYGQQTLAQRRPKSPAHTPNPLQAPGVGRVHHSDAEVRGLCLEITSTSLR